MKYYAIAKKTSVTYGHGDFGEELSICQVNPYVGKKDFHPLFENKEDAEDYLSKLKSNTFLVVVELSVFDKNAGGERK